MTKAHVHAENMRLYAEDAAKTDEPWTLWQSDNGLGEWIDQKRHPSWLIEANYRRKPVVMVTMGRHSWPEPLKEKPSNGFPYWVIDIAYPEEPERNNWGEATREDEWLCSGICHYTKEAAIAHALSLIEISKGNL